MSVVGTTTLTALTFTCDGEPLRVTVLEQSGQADPRGQVNGFADRRGPART